MNKNFKLALSITLLFFFGFLSVVYSHLEPIWRGKLTAMQANSSNADYVLFSLLTSHNWLAWLWTAFGLLVVLMFRKEFFGKNNN
jgi:hypothetical protein